jgi:hypothetical protein
MHDMTHASNLQHFKSPPYLPPPPLPSILLYLYLMPENSLLLLLLLPEQLLALLPTPILNARAGNKVISNTSMRE